MPTKKPKLKAKPKPKPDPTHVKLSIQTINAIIVELRKLPMDQVEHVVNALRKAEPTE